MELDARQFDELTSGGECHMHHHPVDQVFNHIQLEQMQATMVVTNVSANYTALSTDDIIVADTTAGNVTITLPLAKNSKEFIVCKKVAANSLIIAFTGGELVFGSATLTLTTIMDGRRLKSITGGYILLDSDSPETAATIAAIINGVTSKATPVDADRFPATDSAASFALKYVTWANIKTTLLATWKDATGGLVGLTLFKINFKNAANTFTSFLTNANTAARTYTFKDADGTMAFTSDIGTAGALTADTDGTLAANSDSNVATQKATKTYADTKQATSGKDATGGYAGLTLFKINFKNAANTFTSFLTNSNTAARTYTFPDADISLGDKAGSSSQAFAASDLTCTSLNGGQLAGFHNMIINGAFRVAQIGTSFAAYVSGTYHLDGWLTNNPSAAVLTISQDTAVVPVGDSYSLKTLVTTADASVAAGDAISHQTRIEGYTFARAKFGTASAKAVTLSFPVYSSKTGIFCATLHNSANDRSYVVEYTISAANTWETKSITFPGDTSGTWIATAGIGARVIFTQMCGSTFQTTANTWAAGNYLATSNQVNVADTTSAVFHLGKVQFEVGSQATPFEELPLSVEEDLCEYFYEKSFARGTAPAQNVGVNTGEFTFSAITAGAVTQRSAKIHFRKRKRIAPAMVMFNPSAANAEMRDLLVPADLTSSAISSITENGFRASGVGNAATVANNTLGFHWTADARL